MSSSPHTKSKIMFPVLERVGYELHAMGRIHHTESAEQPRIEPGSVFLNPRHVLESGNPSSPLCAPSRIGRVITIPQKDL